MADDDSDTDASERAAKRWRWRLLLPGVLGGLAGPLFTKYLFGGADRDNSLAADLVGAAVGVGVVVGLALLVTRRKPELLTGDGWFSAPSVMALDRGRRCQVKRAVRLAQPGADPSLRAAEEDLALRTVRRARSGTVTVVVVAVGAALFVVFGNLTTAGKFFFGVAAGVLLVQGLRGAWLIARARAYLRASPS